MANKKTGLLIYLRDTTFSLHNKQMIEHKCEDGCIGAHFRSIWSSLSTDSTVVSKQNKNRCNMCILSSIGFDEEMPAAV